jgi:NAD(P)-dependent dehydrogenase (short-subunit alcohol dehydrogenase family)
VRTGYYRGRCAAITGAASGIGRAFAERLAEFGTHLELADVDGTALRATAEAIAQRAAAAGGSVHATVVDVRRRRDVRTWLDGVVARHGQLHFLFNNAGVERICDALDMSDADWDELRAVNVDGVVHGVQAAYPVMARQGFGHIVNTASAAGLIATPGLTGYGMTKHAVVGLTVALACEAHRFGVRVHAICPGVIDTPMARRPLGDGTIDPALAERSLRDLPGPERVVERVLPALPKGRVLIPVTREAHLLHWLYRLWPGGSVALIRRLAIPRMGFLREAPDRPARRHAGDTAASREHE